jgi:SEC-C motif
MKIGRNDPCPCGSGKKYKKCCLLKKQDTVTITNAEDADFDKQDTGFDEQELLFNFINNFRSHFLEKKPHIKEYKKIRKLHGDIVSSMADYHDSGKFERKVDLNYVSDFTSAHKKEDSIKDNTVILLESNFDLDTREGFNGFYDMLIYKNTPNTNCITEEFIQKHRYRKHEKIEFLQSMLNSTLGLFEITKADSEEGYAYIKEVFTGSEYKITDVALSGDKNHDKFYIYTRIITYHNVSFDTGLNLTFSKTDPFIKSYIKREKKDYIPLAEFRRFVELYNRFSRDVNKVHIITNRY